MKLRVRHLAGFALVIAACASTSEPPGSFEDGGSSVLPSGDASVDTDAGTGEGGSREPDSSLPDAAPRTCSDDDFCHSAVPSGTHFRGLWGDGTGVLWAISAEQDVLRWDGSQWKVHYHSEDSLLGIWGSGPTELWLVTSTGLLHGTGATSDAIAFADGGFMPGDATALPKSVWGTGPVDVWCVGGVEGVAGDMRGRVLRWVDDPDLGLRWQLDDELSAMKIAFRGVWGSSGSGVWLHGVQRNANLTVRPRLLHRSPGETSWTSIDLPSPEIGKLPHDIVSVGMSSDRSIWLIGNAEPATKVIWRGTSDDGGSTYSWRAELQDSLRPANAVWGVGLDDTWVIGGTGRVTHWDGASYQQAAIRVSSQVVSRDLWAIWGKGNDDFWVVGDEIAMHRTHAGKP